MKKLLLFLLLLVETNLVFGQETIFTDRPNVTDAVGVIAPGTFQVEAGFLYSDFSNSTAYDIPNLNIKYGVLERLELRLITTHLYQNREVDGANDNTTTGLIPITFSPKLALTEQNGWVPKSALVAGFTFPNLGAAEAYDIDDFEGKITGLFEYTWGSITWTNSIGKVYSIENSGISYTTVLSTMLADKLGSYVELFGNAGQHFDTSYNIDLGLTYVVTDDLQVDIIYGTAIDERDYYFFGFGAAWRTNFKE